MSEKFQGPSFTRAILHVDMDAFYASVEQRENPSLRGQPVIVGGLGPRGVVAAASYEARAAGVHSAMPGGQARRLCPEGHFLRPRISFYAEVSREVFKIFRSVTPMVEGLSLDEAFLDVTASRKLMGGIEAIGRLLKSRILEELGLIASVGMAHNKFLAKLASDVDKPDGFYRVLPNDVQRFLDPMPISRLWGVGPKTAPRLKQLGILTIGQLRKASIERLQPALGNRSEHYHRLAKGEDSRPVGEGSVDKSVSNEVTFDIDITQLRVLEARLLQLTESVGRRLRAADLVARTIQVKIRDRQFKTFSRSRTLRGATCSNREIFQMALALLKKWRHQYPGVPVRLLGVGVTNIESRAEAAARGVPVSSGPHSRVDQTMDKINERYGESTLHRGSGESAVKSSRSKKTTAKPAGPDNSANGKTGK